MLRAPNVKYAKATFVRRITAGRITHLKSNPTSTSFSSRGFNSTGSRARNVLLEYSARKRASKRFGEAYEYIVYWCQNVFMTLTGASRIKFINEITRRFDQWSNNTSLKSITLKTIRVIQALLLQKPSRKSKARDHVIALERQLKLRDEGNINELLNESKEIQERLLSINTPMNLLKISMKFKHLMQKGNVN